MSSTGLLGINPYKRGVAIDISSKPTQMLIQLQQKEQAKNEALDKYFMDYDKNITPAGMRNQDIEGLMKRKNEAKQYYFQNKEAIRRPELDNGKAYSQFMGMNTDQLGFVSKSKEQTGKAKAFSTAMTSAQKAKEIVDDGVAQGIALNELALDDPRRIDFDIANFKTYKPHSAYEYQKELKTLNTIPGKPELIKEGNYQYSRTPMEADVNNIKSFAYNKLNDTGYTKMLEHLSDEELNRLDQVYQQKTNMKLPKNDIKEISLAYTLTNLPKDYTQTNLVASPEYASRLIESRKTPPGTEVVTGNLLDTVGSVEAINLSSGGKVEKGFFTDKSNNPYNGTIYLKRENIPASLYSTLASAGYNKDLLDFSEGLTFVVKEGRAQLIKDKELGVFDRQAIENAQLAANKEPMKGRQPVIGAPIAPPSPKKETLAEKMRRLKK